jgi:hypothetical protein
MKQHGDERSRRMAEVLRLHLVEGKGIRTIARQMKLHRKTVRKQERAQPPRVPILAPYQEEIRSRAAPTSVPRQCWMRWARSEIDELG